MELSHVSTISIGDIHGNRSALLDILDQIRGEVGPDDTVVFLGDYIDRGPDTRACIEAILELRRSARAEVVCLLGNHEDWLLRTLHDHRRHSWLLGMEAFDTIRSYSPDAARVLSDAVSSAGAGLYLERGPLPYEVFFNAVPEEHIRFFESLRVYYRTAELLCTHGGLDPRIGRLEEQSREAMIWGAGGFPSGYEGAEIIVYGHWNNAVLTAGWPTPAIVGRTIGIDTISHGVLTALRLPDGRVFQSARYEPIWSGG
jgi:serine/threonine protein phosphatase 1